MYKFSPNRIFFQVCAKIITHFTEHNEKTKVYFLCNWFIIFAPYSNKIPLVEIIMNKIHYVWH